MQPMRILWCAVFAVSCASSAGPDATAPASSPPRTAPAPASPTPAPPTTPATAPGPRVCAPVAACNMFVRCALAEEVRGADGGAAYRVLVYDHHPNRVGELWPMAETCWDARGEHHCANALQYTSAVCTPTPPAQMELDYACRMDGERCILVEH